MSRAARRRRPALVVEPVAAASSRDQNLRRDPELLVKPANHWQLWRVLAVQDLVYPLALADERLQILDRQTALHDAEFDGFKRIRRTDGQRLDFIGLDKRGQDIRAFIRWRPLGGVGLDQRRDLSENGTGLPRRLRLLAMTGAGEGLHGFGDAGSRRERVKSGHPTVSRCCQGR